VSLCWNKLRPFYGVEFQQIAGLVPVSFAQLIDIG
jgi:hypothetical protein